MNTPNLSRLLLAGLLTFSGALATINISFAASEPEGSGLPPGINPSSPAGGNGGDADGYDKKPAMPAPAGTQKKAEQKHQPATPRSDEPKHPVKQKKNDAQTQ